MFHATVATKPLRSQRLFTTVPALGIDNKVVSSPCSPYPSQLQEFKILELWTAKLLNKLFFL
jgi:hypothetical protein